MPVRHIGPRFGAAISCQYCGRPAEYHAKIRRNKEYSIYYENSLFSCKQHLDLATKKLKGIVRDKISLKKLLGVYLKMRGLSGFIDVNELNQPGFPNDSQYMPQWENFRERERVEFF